MANQPNELTAYCGLYCGDCVRYKSRAADLARDLADELQRVRFDKYAEVKDSSVGELEYYSECLQVLDAITRLKCNASCRTGGDGCSQPCKIKRCVESKNLEGCWQCDEFERCEKFDFLKRYHGDAPQKNLRKIKRYGLGEWVQHREGFFPWSQ